MVPGPTMNRSWRENRECRWHSPAATAATAVTAGGGGSGDGCSDGCSDGCGDNCDDCSTTARRLLDDCAVTQAAAAASTAAARVGSEINLELILPNRYSRMSSPGARTRPEPFLSAHTDYGSRRAGDRRAEACERARCALLHWRHPRAGVSCCHSAAQRVHPLRATQQTSSQQSRRGLAERRRGSADQEFGRGSSRESKVTWDVPSPRSANNKRHRCHFVRGVR